MEYSSRSHRSFTIGVFVRIGALFSIAVALFGCHKERVDSKPLAPAEVPVVLRSSIAARLSRPTSGNGTSIAAIFPPRRERHWGRCSILMVPVAPPAPPLNLERPLLLASRVSEAAALT